MIENMPICTHLSNHILSSQSSLGKASPGRVKRTEEIISQPEAEIKDRYFFVKDFFAIIKDNLKEMKKITATTKEIFV